MNGPERRYTRDEIESIFAAAADAQEGVHGASASTGLTLSEMQEIGVEAGISRDAIARAAHALETPKPSSVSGSLLGFPIRVGETAELGRRLTDEEWERVVVMLRETFNARGKLDATGSFRQWTNGNLQALLEPGENGHRLRLQTYNQQARAFMGIGLGALGIGVISTMSAAISGVLSTESIASLSGMFVMGTGLFALGAARLPSWSRMRRQQMRAILARLQNHVIDTAARPQSDEGESS
jgi:hypothetical protein